MAPEGIHLQRVEGVSFPVGFPDVMVYANGRVGFLELKQHTKTSKIRMTPQQKLFFQKARFFNIRAYIVASDETRMIKVLKPSNNLLINKTFSEEDIATVWPLGEIEIDWTRFQHLFN
jgi:hypothetical protein